MVNVKTLLGNLAHVLRKTKKGSVMKTSILIGIFCLFLSACKTPGQNATRIVDSTALQNARLAIVPTALQDTKIDGSPTAPAAQTCSPPLSQCGDSCYDPSKSCCCTTSGRSCVVSNLSNQQCSFVCQGAIQCR
jgi:hypothetical protein